MEQQTSNRLAKVIPKGGFHWADLIALVAVAIALFGYRESRIAREQAEQAVRESTAEDLRIRALRVNTDYSSKYHRAFCFRCMWPSPATVEVLWDLTIINNGQRDVALIEYEVAPIQGMFAQYDLGLSDFTTGQPVALPVSLSAGHAVRFKLRSLLVIPGHVAMDLEKRFGEKYRKTCQNYHRSLIDCMKWVSTASETASPVVLPVLGSSPTLRPTLKINALGSRFVPVEASPHRKLYRGTGYRIPSLCLATCWLGR